MQELCLQVTFPLIQATAYRRHEGQPRVAESSELNMLTTRAHGGCVVESMANLKMVGCAKQAHTSVLVEMSTRTSPGIK